MHENERKITFYSFFCTIIFTFARDFFIFVVRIHTDARPHSRGFYQQNMNELTIRQKIYEIRGKRVMLDRDLAAMYGVETKRLNESVKRNISRFEGDDFMFQLTKDEANQIALQSQDTTLDMYVSPEAVNQPTHSRSQFTTLNKGRGSNMKYLPYAFTELGVAMLSSVLRSETAINVNRGIMRAFVYFRQLSVSLPQFTANSDIVQLRKDFEELKQDIDDILHDQNDINEATRAQLDAVSEALAELQAKGPRQLPHRRIGFIQEESK